MTVPAASAATVTGTLRVAVAPTVRFGVPVQVTSPALVVQVQPVAGVKEAGAPIPVGSRSVTVTLPEVAALPLFVTVRVYAAPLWFTVQGPLLPLVMVSWGCGAQLSFRSSSFRTFASPLTPSFRVRTFTVT